MKWGWLAQKFLDQCALLGVGDVQSKDGVRYVDDGQFDSVLCEGVDDSRFFVGFQYGITVR